LSVVRSVILNGKTIAAVELEYECVFLFPRMTLSLTELSYSILIWTRLRREGALLECVRKNIQIYLEMALYPNVV